MAVRYSGDVEVRVRWDRKRRAYVGEVRCPRRPPCFDMFPARGIQRTRPMSSESYDAAARTLLANADKLHLERYGRTTGAERKGRSYVVLRVFQAACPFRCPE